MNEFKLSKNRDAWFVIRGYKYQIDLTIKRWLSLKDDQKLVLEYGEDIDIVNGSMLKGADRFDRVVEQVKHLENSITLRSSPCKIALANAIQHFKNNPQLNLAFRFCTNSLVTTERPSPFLDRKPAIEVWEELRLKILSEPERTERLTKLQSFLSTLDDQPQGVDLLTWNSFKDHVKNISLNELEELIRSFEWSTQESNAEDISQEIFQLLKAKKVDVSNLEDVYPRLFLRVIELLSKREEKILDLNLLDATLRLPALDVNEIKLLGFLKSEILSHSIRIEQLEKDSKQHEKLIAGIQQKLLEERYGPQISLALSTAIGDISTELPSQVKTISKRETTVSGLKKILNSKNWLAIYGSIGCGKTQIASLLGEQLSAVIYVSLRDLNTDEANFLIHHLFTQLCDDQRTSTITESGLNALEEETVLFLDDVPRLISGNSLSRCLIEIAEKMAEKGHKLVTLSHYTIPQSIPDVLKKATFHETPSPSMNSIETKELFEKHGAPEGIITPEIAESFVQSTSGNPTIIAATARSISSAGWDQLEAFRAQSFNLALRGELVEETIARLLSTVESNNSRELLYRLCVVIGLFGKKEIDSVASVSPKVNRPNEAYSHLQGLWIEKQTENTAFICPLIAQFGQDELEENVKITVANKLAELVFKSSGLSPIDFAKGIGYLKLARNGPSLGMHLLSGLRKSLEFPEGWKKLIYQTSISEGLLDDCPKILALMIKAIQVHLALSLNRSIGELISQASQLIQNSRKEDFWGVFIYAIQTASIVAKVNLREGLDLCGFVLSNFEKVKELEDHEESLPESSPLFDDEYLSSFPWFFVPEIKNTDDFNNWFKLISDLPKETASKIFSCDLAKGGLQLLLDRLWMIQHQVSAKSQNFDDALQCYDTVISYAKINHFRWVQALAVRSKIIVYAEYRNDIKTATQLASDFLDSGKNDDEILFLIQHILGRQYLFKDQMTEASKWLSMACELNADEFKDLKCHAFIELSRAIGDSDSNKALAKAESAVRIARQNPNAIHSKLMIRALGEASIAAWYNHNKSLAFDYLDEALLVLFQHFEETTEWKMNSVLLAQVLGYMSSVSSTGFPPEESYIKPERGFLSIYNEELANWYDQTMDVRTVALISYLLVVFSSSLGKHNRAIFWANRGIDDARKKSILPSIFLLGETLIASLIKKSQTEKVLDYASEAAIALTASMVASNKGIHSVLQNQNPLMLMGEKPNQYWNQAESLALFLGVLPTMLHFSVLEDDNKRKLEILVSYCTEQAKDSSDPNVFNSISAAIKCSFEEKPSFKLRDFAMKEYKAGNRAGATANFIMASFSKETHLNAAISYHALIMHEYSSKIPTNSTLWLFLTDDLLLYWSRIFESRKFSFLNPPYLEASLNKINLLAPEKRVQNLIRILMDGLKVILPIELEFISNWLYDAKEEI